MTGEVTGMKLRPRMTPAEIAEKEKQALNEKEQQAKKVKLDKEVWQRRPFIRYSGVLKYHTELIDCAVQCDGLLKRANESTDVMVVGFDMEWPFSFQTGPGKTAVIQISPDLNTCYILHVSQLRSLPKTLSEFLAHSNVRLTGNNIKNDIRKLVRDFAGFDADKLIQNCIDLGVLANSILPVRQRWSLEKLVDYMLNMKINKDKKVRMSKWHVVPLSKSQQKYAAIDSYASLLLYFKLKERELELLKEEENEESFKEQDQNVSNIKS